MSKNEAPTHTATTRLEGESLFLGDTSLPASLLQTTNPQFAEQGVASLVPQWNADPASYIRTLRTMGTRPEISPALWKALTAKGIQREVFATGTELPLEVVEGLIRSDIFTPATPDDESVRPDRQAVRSAFGAYLNSPLGEFVNPRVQAHKIHKHYSKTYAPVATAIGSMLRQFRRTQEPALVDKLGAFLGWFERDCTIYLKDIGKIHPDTVAHIFEKHTMDDTARGDFNGVESLFAFARQFVDSEKLDTQTGGALPISSLAEQRIQAELQSSRAVMNRRIKEPETHFTHGALEQVVTEFMQQKAAPQMEGDGWLSGVLASLNSSPFATTVIEVGHQLVASTLQKGYRRSGYPQAVCDIVAVPGIPLGFISWVNEETKSQALEHFRRRIWPYFKENAEPMTDAQWETEFRFLLNDLPPDSQQRIDDLTHTILGAAHALHSRGYVDTLRRAPNTSLKRIGVDRIMLRQHDGLFEVSIGQGESDLRVTIDADGACTFPDGFLDPEARQKAELIAKAHMACVVNLVEPEKRKERPAPAPNEAGAEEQKAEDSKLTDRVQYFMILPPGRQTRQLDKTTANAAVKRFLGRGKNKEDVDLETFNLLFMNLQEDPHFDPQNKNCVYSIPYLAGFSGLVKEKLFTLVARLYQKYPPDLCHNRQVSYIPEINKTDPASGSFELSTNSAVRDYATLIPKELLDTSAIEGIVYQANAS